MQPFWILAVLMSQEEGRELGSKAERELRERVERLGSAEAEEREESESGLRAGGSETLSRIAGHLKREQDPEIRARLMRVLSHLHTRRADELFQEGKLKDALDHYAKAEGAVDPSAFVRDRLDKNRSRIRLLFPQSLDNLHWTYDFGAMAREIRAQDGPWGMVALFEELAMEINETPVQTINVMQEAGAEMVPLLAEALHSSNETLRVHALASLVGMANRGTRIQETTRLKEGLQAFCSGEYENSWMGRDAQRVLRAAAAWSTQKPRRP